MLKDTYDDLSRFHLLQVALRIAATIVLALENNVLVDFVNVFLCSRNTLCEMLCFTINLPLLDGLVVDRHSL